MGMTFLEMQDRVLELGNYGTVDRDRVKLFLNATKRDIESRPYRFSWMETSSDVTTVASTRTLAVPTLMKIHGRLIPADTDYDPPTWVDYQDFITDSYPFDYGNTSEGVPVRYSILATNYVFEPIPDAAYVYRAVYWAYSADMSANGDTSPIPDAHEDVLLYGCLMHMAARDKDPQMMAYWQDMYEGKIRNLRGDSQLRQSESVQKVPMPRHYHGTYDY